MRIVDTDCEVTNCSGNGSCVEENEEKICKCNEGFYMFDCSLNNES